MNKFAKFGLAGTALLAAGTYVMFAALIKVFGDAELDPEEFEAYDRGGIHDGDPIFWSESTMSWNRRGEGDPPKPQGVTDHWIGFDAINPRGITINVDPASKALIDQRFGAPLNLDELFESLFENNSARRKPSTLTRIESPFRRS